MTSGAAVNDAILSGSIDVAMAGLTVLLNLHDKTGGQNTIKGMMAIADSPITFNTIDPRIKSIKDFQDTDRIAMTAGKSTQHAVVLQMAAAAAIGWENQLDALTVRLSHPNGVVGLLSGGRSFKTHATTVRCVHPIGARRPKVRTLFQLLRRDWRTNWHHGEKRSLRIFMDYPAIEVKAIGRKRPTNSTDWG
jgi:NitT/TauT family transport system substrate-binding protein